MPKISVIVPVYKVEQYLHRCVDSILAQTFTDFELILVDDGSPDDCPIICDEYAQKDARVHVIHKINGGLSDARNAGIDWVFANSDSEWITFIDSDDWVHIDLLKILLEGAMRWNMCISVCGVKGVKYETECIANTRYSYAQISIDDYYLNYLNCAVLSVAKLYQKVLFTYVRYPVGRIYEDAFTTWKLLFSSKTKLTLIEQPLYYYYQNYNGIMQTASRNFSIRNYDSLFAREERKKFFETYGYDRLALREEESIAIEIASFSLLARKAGIYKSIPDEYQMGRVRAIKTLKRMLDVNRYEAVMVKCYPRLVKLQAYWRRIKEIVLKK